MLQEARDVLNKYRSDSEYLFPIFLQYHKTEQQRRNRLHKVITKVNDALKEIGKELGIPIDLTTYVARHSYATVLKRSGVSTAIISESLGHSSERVTQIYLDSFENQPDRRGDEESAVSHRTSNQTRKGRWDILSFLFA